MSNLEEKACELSFLFPSRSLHKSLQMEQHSCNVSLVVFWIYNYFNNQLTFKMTYASPEVQSQLIVADRW